MSGGTREKLLDGALATLVERGIAGTSARAVAAAAGVNQALVFYHFGTLDELLAAACRRGAEQRVAVYRDRLDAVRDVGGLLALARELRTAERAGGHVTALAQLLAGAQSQPRLAPAVAAGLGLWTAELERVLARVLREGPLAGLVDVAGLATAVVASFVGLQLHEGADPEGAERAFAALEQLGDVLVAVDELGPVARRVVRARLRGSGPERA
ncbi:TetR/AcrR family transcriptional regulator [Pseudonocardia humida]|uniref:TetR/AcrR family transcriptional regulator n=1 Tax=Pseudonocardia humida TaxID=2800819 RepID=A0ABT0ZSC2_9PSEU|nr:TetR/AcrR family transcriptional regulator [Pseudonocardia humida]MCO1653616.1 TetR/AcrR family transcriptional regulator [Pseudonocardia humida]